MGDVTRPGLWERVLFLLFPARCLWCGKAVEPEGFFCVECRGEAEVPGVRRFALQKSGKTLEVFAPAVYRGGYRETLHRYKFRGQKGLSGQLGRLMAGEALSLCGEIDGVAYVPLSRKGRRARGYDQSRLLAKAAAGALGVPLAEVLEKSKENQCQHGLGRSARMENVKGVYRAGPEAKGRALLLVDDIVTTGATLCQCAEALYEAGAVKVYGLCAASAQKGRGDGYGAPL